jgi:hypothetical protein
MIATVGVLILSLVLAPPAWAACAWVLWVEESWNVVYQRDERPATWTLVEAHQSQDDCARAQAGKIAALAKGKDVEVKSNIVSRTFPRAGHADTPLYQNTRIVCVPDTVDPRGPRGGGR